MKTLNEVLSYILEEKQTFVNVAKNLKDEIKSFSSSKDDLEKKYTKVLRDVSKTIDKHKKLHNKEDEMTWDSLKDIISKSKAFKDYDKDKMTDVTDFKHMMD